MARLGHILWKENLISKEELEEALNIQSKTDEKLGDILINNKTIKRKDLYKTLAKQKNMPFFDILKYSFNSKKKKKIDKIWTFPNVKRYWAFVFDINKDKVKIAITDKSDKEKIVKKLNNKGITKIKFYITTDWDYQQYLYNFCNKKASDFSIYSLYRKKPEESALYVLSEQQKVFLFFFTGINIVLLLEYTLTYFTVLMFLIIFFYLVFILFKTFIVIVGFFVQIYMNISKHKEKEDKKIKDIDDKILPIYTVLVPVFKEPEVMPTLIEGLSNLDWPKSKLDIKILFEEVDKETYNIAKSLNPPSFIKLVVVPNSYPRTKPKACNYGTIMAKGEYLTIFDAEDIPEKDQLKKAYAKFKSLPDDYICIQAALNYYNKDENALTKLFTLEYSYWFDYMLKGLYVMNYPIPLGGTSNHFKTKELRKIGMWDPFNVTEDADLGIRATVRNYRVGILESTTYEEANSNTKNWIRQRSRWIKGYMQTWLVHNRNPIKKLRELGLKRYISFNLLIGGTPLTFLLNPIMIAITLYISFTENAYILEDPFLKMFAIVGFILGNVSAIIISMIGAIKRKYYSLIPYAILAPSYWLLHSVAAYLALYELIIKPHYWQKTNHGISSVRVNVNQISKKPSIDEFIDDMENPNSVTAKKSAFYSESKINTNRIED